MAYEKGPPSWAFKLNAPVPPSTARKATCVDLTILTVLPPLQGSKASRCWNCLVVWNHDKQTREFFKKQLPAGASFFFCRGLQKESKKMFILYWR
jgi:hypothetical protein